MSDAIKRKIQDAMDIVKEIPKPYHNIAFDAVLKHLLSSDGNVPDAKQRKPESIPTTPKIERIGINRHKH